jgi:Tol biopolymer transport system component
MNTARPGRWIGTAKMPSIPRLFLVLSVWLLFLAGCSLSGDSQTLESANPTADAPVETISPTESLTEAAREVAITTPTSTELAPLPTSSLPAIPSPTPAPVIRRLTDGGCCVDPFWSPDGSQVLYIDRPAQDSPAGLWGIDAQGGEPQFITDQMGLYSPDMQLRAYLENGATFVQNQSTGEIWRIPNGGRAVSFAPDNAWLAWTAGQTGPPFDSAHREVWISRVDGSEAQQVFAGVRAGLASWFPDGRMLVSGLVGDGSKNQALWVLTPGGQSELVELVRGDRLREIIISPNGEWVAYLVTFSDDPAQDGLWLVNTGTGDQRRLDVFGGYQWRDGQNLLVVPLDFNQIINQVLQVEAATGQVHTITEPGSTPFKIANGDWSISPGGGEMIFVSREDNNIWLIELPESVN